MIVELTLAFVQVLAAYVLVDAMTGVYHLATDRGWNTKEVCGLFQNHHETNTMDGFDSQPMWISVPFMVAGVYFLSPFLLAAGSFGVLSQIPHYYAHRRSDNRYVHRVVRWMQATGLILPPLEHAGHHDGRFEKNFCILSGWNNWWLNYLAHLTQFNSNASSTTHFPPT